MEEAKPSRLKLILTLLFDLFMSIIWLVANTPPTILYIYICHILNVFYHLWGLWLVHQQAYEELFCYDMGIILIFCLKFMAGFLQFMMLTPSVYDYATLTHLTVSCLLSMFIFDMCDLLYNTVQIPLFVRI